MICLVALIVFAVLALLSCFGFVSAKYRTYFLEASDCVFKKVTLRKCTTGFDQRMKMKVSTKVSLHNKTLGGFIFRNFEVISWIFVVLMIVSMLWSGYVGIIGVYNWYAFGNCNGPNSSELCVFNSLTGVVQPNPVVVPDSNVQVGCSCKDGNCSIVGGS
jgi:hypothetical protein